MDEEAGRTLPGISGDHCPAHTLTRLRSLDFNGMEIPVAKASEVVPGWNTAPGHWLKGVSSARTFWDASHRERGGPGISRPTRGLWNCCTWLWLALILTQLTTHT